MNRIVKRKLNYDFVQDSWYINSNNQYGPPKIQTIYWGAKKVPLMIRVRGRNVSHSMNQKYSTNALFQIANNRTIVGPLIGILTSRGKRTPIGGMISNFIDIIRTGEKNGGIVFVFTPESINWGEETISGYMYLSAQRRWKKYTFPFPNVVYNRIPRRDHERKTNAAECLAQLQKVPNLSLFNPTFFNKKVLFQFLEGSHTVRPHLPKTKSLFSKQDLLAMLKEHSSVYLKPTHGKAGAGIIKVERDTANKAFLFYGAQKQSAQTFRNIDSLWSTILKRAISSPYIVQQAIDLATYDNSPFDARVLVQKNEKGKWQVTGIGIRVAGQNRITTHVPRGGRVESAEQVLGRSFSKEQGTRIETKMKELAVNIATELERHFTLLGEMSMDIGVDSQGKLWFFEANSKPMKFDEPEIRKKSLENLIHYSQYLTFDQNKNEGRKHHAIAQFIV